MERRLPPAISATRARGPGRRRSERVTRGRRRAAADVRGVPACSRGLVRGRDEARTEHARASPRLTLAAQGLRAAGMAQWLTRAWGRWSLAPDSPRPRQDYCARCSGSLPSLFGSSGAAPIDLLTPAWGRRHCASFIDEWRGCLARPSAIPPAIPAPGTRRPATRPGLATRRPATWATWHPATQHLALRTRHTGTRHPAPRHPAPGTWHPAPVSATEIGGAPHLALTRIR